jgi:hypothetical protein
MPVPYAGYAVAMSSDADDGTRPDLDEQVGTRAEPLPEEVAAGDDGDRLAAAGEILRDSEERMAEAVDGNAPGDAAQESRRSEETA